MSEADTGGTGEPSDDGVDRLYLAKILRSLIAEKTTRAAPGWLADNAIDPVTGKKVLSPSGASDRLTAPAGGWIAMPTIRGIAHALGVPHSAIYLPNAIAGGLDAPASGLFASMLPAVVDRLPPEDQLALRDALLVTATQLARARGIS